MIFSSPRFLAFFALLLIVLALPWALRDRKRIIILASCVFYAAWDYRYVPLLLGVTLIDYLVGRSLGHTDQPGRRRWLVVASIAANLGVLGYFKYCDFFVDNINSLLAAAGLALPLQEVVLPVGISFYTFMSMSYTIDIYRRRLTPVTSLREYLTFMTFFPSMIAGPIVRASEFLPQLDRPMRATAERLRIGGSIFLLGLIAKRVVADRLAQFADPVFAQPAVFDTPSVWLGVLCYTGQIYCDFAAYSLMAIGVAKCLGIDLPQNFRLPYLSTSIAEFWRRWHMTLSFWLRDYLYISLGGNRHGEARTYLALLTTMLLGGLWHGASWNFVIWGGAHGLALAVHRMFRHRWRWQMPPVAGWALTLLFVTVAWVPFRAQDLSDTLELLGRMFVPQSGAQFLSPVAVALLGVLIAAQWLGRQVDANAPGNALARGLQVFGLDLRDEGMSGRFLVWRGNTVGAWWLLAMLLLVVFWFSVLETSPFVYFQF